MLGYWIKLEWLKWSKHNVFRLCTIAYMVLLPAILLAGKRIPELPPPMVSNKVLFIFPTVWEYLGYVGNWLAYFLLGLLGVILVTTEYSQKTFRQNVISGLERKEFLFSKIAFYLLICLGATLYYMFTALLIGYFNTESIYWQKVWQNAALAPRYFLMCFGYMSLGMFFGFLIKRTALALIAFMGYSFFLEPVIRWAVHRNIWVHPSMHYYPVNAFEDLVPAPFVGFADEFLKEFGFSLFLSPATAVVISAVYIGLFLWVSRRIVQKSDL